MTNNLMSGPLGPVPADRRSTALELDFSRYDAELGNLDLTEAQRTELLATLWSIMQNLVELGYSVADVDICGSIFGDFSAAASPSSNAVDSSSQQQGAGKAQRKAEDSGH